MKKSSTSRWAGVLLVLVPLGVEVWRELAEPDLGAVRLVAREPREAPDHLQLLFVVHDRDALQTPLRVVERFLPRSKHADFEVSELGIHGWIDAFGVGQRSEAESGRVVCASWTELSRHETSIPAASSARFDPGDGESFFVLEPNTPVAGWGAALTARPQKVSLLARPVHLESMSEESPGREFLDRLAPLFRGPLLHFGLRHSGASDPVLRVISESAPGALLCLIGLIMLIGGSVWRRCVLAAFALCIGLSLVHRARLGRDLRALDSMDAPQRVAAAARLGANTLHPRRAAEAICNRVREEADPQFQVALLTALAHSTQYCARSAPVDRLLEEPESTDPAVQGARERLLQHRKKAEKLEEAFRRDPSS